MTGFILFVQQYARKPGIESGRQTERDLKEKREKLRDTQCEGKEIEIKMALLNMQTILKRPTFATLVVSAVQVD